MTMGQALARHMLARTGFGGRPAEIDAFAKLSLERGVDSLIAGLRTTATSTPPAFVEEPAPGPARNLSRAERKARRRRFRTQARQLQGWWLQEMVTTPSPLTERLTLMWHNHFTSSLRKARWPTLMYRQIATIRKHSTGSFQGLLDAMLRDPAMLVYLDNHRNRVGKPNENLARELYELFALGPGNYTELDIKETARALTGFGVNRRDGTARFRPGAHDTGTKRILGQTGAFSRDQLPALIAAQKATATHITRRVYREFVGGEPDAPTLAALTEKFRSSGLNIGKLLRAVLLSPSFRDPRGFGTMVRSPVDVLVATLRVLNLPVRDWTAVANASRRLGQSLLEPPNVKGWPGGTAWINAPTLLARQAVVRRALRGMDTQAWTWPQVAAWLGNPGLASTPEILKAEAARVLLPLPPLSPVSAAAKTPMDLFDHVLLDPTYQLT